MQSHLIFSAMLSAFQRTAFTPGRFRMALGEANSECWIEMYVQRQMLDIRCSVFLRVEAHEMPHKVVNMRCILFFSRKDNNIVLSW